MEVKTYHAVCIITLFMQKNAFNSIKRHYQKKKKDFHLLVSWKKEAYKSLKRVALFSFSLFCIMGFKKGLISKNELDERRAIISVIWFVNRFHGSISLSSGQIIQKEVYSSIVELNLYDKT